MIQIASYNLWNGSDETYFRLVDFIKEQKFDVLCLQEINGWQNADFARLKDFADRCGFTEYEYGNSNSEHKLASLSVLPVTKQTVHQEGFWHCVVEIHVAIDGVETTIFNLDLDPWNEDARLGEIERLLKVIDPSKPTIITGDLNSLSRQDNYPPEFLQQLQAHGINKFGQGQLDFRVTDRLAAAGFVDVAVKLQHIDTTVPSPYAEGKEQEVPARVDYAFVSSHLVPMVQSFSVLKTAEADKISDHYPVVLTLGEKSDKPDAAEQPAPPDTKPPEAPPTPLPKAEPPQPEEPKNTATEGEIRLH